MIHLELALLHRSRAGRRFAALAIPIAFVLAASPTTAMGRGRSVSVTVVWSTWVAPQAAPDPLRIRIEPSIDDAKLLPEWIRERHGDVASKVPALEGHQQWISVEIGGATYDYRVSVMAMRDGATLGAKKEPEMCECNTEKLLQMIDERIAAAVEEMVATPAPEQVSESKPPVEPQSNPDPKAKGRPSKTRADDGDRPLGTMGYIGIGFGVLGGGMLAAGIPLAKRPDSLRGGPGTLSRYSTRPPGVGLAVGGGAALAAGVALVVVDMMRHRKAPTVAMIPAVESGLAGLLVVRKF